jgi:hypothetical protein
MPPLKSKPDADRLARLNARLRRLHRLSDVTKNLRKARKQAEALLHRSTDYEKKKSE